MWVRHSVAWKSARTAAFDVGKFFHQLSDKNYLKKYFAIGILVAYIYRPTHLPIRNVKGPPFLLQTYDRS